MGEHIHRGGLERRGCVALLRHLHGPAENVLGRGGTSLVEQGIPQVHQCAGDCLRAIEPIPQVERFPKARLGGLRVTTAGIGPRGPFDRRGQITLPSRDAAQPLDRAQRKDQVGDVRGRRAARHVATVDAQLFGQDAARVRLDPHDHGPHRPQVGRCFAKQRNETGHAHQYKRVPQVPAQRVAVLVQRPQAPAPGHFPCRVVVRRDRHRRGEPNGAACLGWIQPQQQRCQLPQGRGTVRRHIQNIASHGGQLVRQHQLAQRGAIAVRHDQDHQREPVIQGEVADDPLPLGLGRSAVTAAERRGANAVVWHYGVVTGSDETSSTRRTLSISSRIRGCTSYHSSAFTK